MKLADKVIIDEISDEFETWKNRSLILELGPLDC